MCDQSKPRESPLAEARIKRSVADTLISGIKLALRLVTEITESGESVYETISAAANRYQHMQPEPDSALSQQDSEPAVHKVYEPTLLDLDEFVDIMRNGTPDQLRDHIIGKQTARNGAGMNEDAQNELALLAASQAPRTEQKPRP